MANGRLRIGYASGGQYSILSEYGQYNLSGQAAGLTYTASSGSDSLTNNAYSGYTTLWLDPLNGDDGNSGESELAAKRTPQAALNLLTGGGRRLIIKPTAIITLTADLVLPAGGSSNDARVVVMGLPDGTDFPEFVLGNFQFLPSLNGSRPFVTVRKVEMRGLNLNGSGGIIRVGWGNPMTDFIGEYLYLHDINNQDDDNAGCIYLQDGAADRAIIRHCRLGDNLSTGGGGYHNGSAVHSYGNENVEVHHCELYDASHAIRYKRPPPSGTGGNFHHNIVHGCDERGFMLQDDTSDSEGDHGGAQVKWNLFYNIGNLPFQVYDPNNTADDIDVEHNTFAEDTVGENGVIQMRPATGVKVRRNVFLTNSGTYFSTRDSASGVEVIDYNLYRSGGTWALGLGTGNEDSFPSLATWQEAKTGQNHPDLGELIAANPDLNSVEVANLADFPNRASRDYTYTGAFVCDDGLPPGYDPNNVGYDWT